MRRTDRIPFGKEAFLLPVDFPSVAAIMVGSVSVVPDNVPIGDRPWATVVGVLEKLAAEARVGQGE